MPTGLLFYQELELCFWGRKPEMDILPSSRPERYGPKDRGYWMSI